ncbi:uncharacterized protein LOC127814037 [Diospyros lotus]|uniref:uncharacterized protein LOC127814037 n=1 Tax=Diospyros lotus TaxID=55363 RepID=UPI0022575638|nr:uncharacterized protein LOC127814037 [Diospyros lotus]
MQSLMYLLPEKGFTVLVLNFESGSHTLADIPFQGLFAIFFSYQREHKLWNRKRDKTLTWPKGWRHFQMNLLGIVLKLIGHFIERMKFDGVEEQLHKRPIRYHGKGRPK